MNVDYHLRKFAQPSTETEQSGTSDSSGTRNIENTNDNSTPLVGSVDSHHRYNTTASNLLNQPGLNEQLDVGEEAGAAFGETAQDNSLFTQSYTSASNPYMAADAGSLGLHAPTPVQMQIGTQPPPRVVTEQHALAALIEDWDTVGGSDGIATLTNLEDLFDDEAASPVLRDAAQYYIEHPQQFEALDTAAKSDDADNRVSTNDVVVRGAEILPEEYMLDSLVRHYGLISDYGLRNNEGGLRLTAVESINPVDARVAALYFATHPTQFTALETAIEMESDGVYSVADVRARQGELGIAHPGQQVSSHNSYEFGDVPAIREMFEEHGVRSFELDLHDNVDNNGRWPMGKERLPEGVWDIRHFGFNDSHGRLGPYLDEINTLSMESNEPITLFLDLKSELGSEGHEVADLDTLLHEQFGDRLFTPAQYDAGVGDGWPSDEQLEGKIIVVLTDRSGHSLEEYHSADRTGASEAAAFIAPKPEIEDGDVVPQDGVVFYNVNAGGNTDNIAATNQRLLDAGFIVRNYGVDPGNFEQLAASGVTFLATDHHEFVAEQLEQ